MHISVCLTHTHTVEMHTSFISTETGKKRKWISSLSVLVGVRAEVTDVTHHREAESVPAPCRDAHCRTPNLIRKAPLSLFKLISTICNTDPGLRRSCHPCTIAQSLKSLTVARKSFV